MTLDTKLYVQGNVDPMEVHRKVEELLGIPETAIRRAEDGEICNAPGQGFDAWVITYHGNGSEVPAQEHDEWCMENCDATHQPAYWVKVSMDTTYGYRGKSGEDCSTLHARTLVELGWWLNERGVDLIWQNEYAGTYHKWNDVQAVQHFLGNGDDAGRWFNGIARPAIEAEIAKELEEKNANSRVEE